MASITALPAAPAGMNSSGNGETVVLLHGLARTSASLAGLERFLTKAGYRVVNVDYPSRRKTVEALAKEDLAPILQAELANEEKPVHFVTHSMGAILLRAYAAAERPPCKIGRIVMLAPPNQGSELTDRLGERALFRWINGPAGAQLSTAADALPNRLPTPAVPIGVIAGDRSLNPFYSRLIPGRDDGKVAVERTKLPGMADFLTVPYSHTWLMCRKAVQKQVLAFLRNGRFGPMQK
jgi:triacylglycerol lipase